jgi:predicted transcriptional regulator
MTLSITLPPETESKLRQRASATGTDVVQFIVQAIEDKLRLPASLSEILAPVHAHTRSVGLSEEELDDIIEECRDEVYAQRQGGAET